MPALRTVFDLSSGSTPSTRDIRGKVSTSDKPLLRRWEAHFFRDRISTPSPLPSSLSVESIPEQVFPCHETDSQLVRKLFPTRRDWLLALLCTGK